MLINFFDTLVNLCSTIFFSNKLHFMYDNYSELCVYLQTFEAALFLEELSLYSKNQTIIYKHTVSGACMLGRHNEKNMQCTVTMN